MRPFRDTCRFVSITARYILAAAAVLLFSQPAAAAIIDVAGFTRGCFGTGCSTFTTPAVNPEFEFTFTGSSFDVDVDTEAGGSASDLNLGTMSRTNEKLTDSQSLPFTLQVTFTLPAEILGQAETFTVLITGKNSGGGPAQIVFDEDWAELTYSNVFGSGSFEFNVTNDPELTPNGSVVILGGIRNATFTPTNTDPPPTNLPEPATLLLLGTGAAAFAFRRRR